MAKPLNIVTWPFVARSLLLSLRQCLRPVEALAVFHMPATDPDAMLQDEICCLTFRSVRGFRASRVQGLKE